MNSSSKKSESSSKPRKPSSRRRSLVLRRGAAELEAFDEKHIPYLYAAYRREPEPEIPADMKVPEFTDWTIKHAEAIYESGRELVMLIGEEPKHGHIPLGMAVVEYHGKIAYPHAWWFPDASPRNKLEIGLLFFLELKKQHTVMVFSRKEFDSYFAFLSTYGVIRKVGRVLDWYGSKDHATLYQSVGS